MLYGLAAGTLFIRGSTGWAAASPTSTPGGQAAGAFTVESVSPLAGATQVPSDTSIEVRFSHPLSLTSPTPTLTPNVGGSWQEVTPTTFAFVAIAPLVPSSTETITVPGGAAGIESATGERLRYPATAQFTVTDGSVLRLQQLLAQVGYLPVSFTPVDRWPLRRRPPSPSKAPSAGGSTYRRRSRRRGAPAPTT